MAPPSLTEQIAELGYSTMEELQEVQARQVIYGGDQETNLLELNLVSEDQLLDALSLVSTLPRPADGPLSIDRQMTTCLLGTGVRAAAGPSLEGGALIYVNASPSREQRDELKLLLGDDATICVSSRVRVEEAIAHAQGQLLEGRLSDLLDRLGTRLPPPEAEPSSADEEAPPFEETQVEVAQNPALPPVVESQDPLSSNATAAALPGESKGPNSPDSDAGELQPMSAELSQLDAHQVALVETGPPPEGYEAMAAAARDPGKTRKPSAGRAPRQIYSRSEAEEDLKSAKSRDRVIDVLIHFAAAHFDYTAVFGVLSKEARGLSATGSGAKADEVKQLKIPLDLPSSFREVRESGVHRIGRLRASGLEGGIARDLKRATGTETFILPINVRGRAVLLLFGDNGPLGVELDELGDLIPFAHLVSDAFERVLIERKRASRVAQVPADVQEQLATAAVAKAPTPAVAPAPPVASAPAVAKAPSTPPPENSAPSATTQTPPPEAPDAAIAPVDANAPRRRPTQRNSAAPAAGDEKVEIVESSASHEVSEVKKRTLTRPGQGPEDGPHFPADAPKTLRGFPEVRSPSQVAREYERNSLELHIEEEKAPQTPARPALMSRRIVAISDVPPARTEAEEERMSEAPPPPAIFSSSAPVPHAEERRTEKSSGPPANAPKGTLMSRRPAISEPDEDGWDSPEAPVVRRIDAIESQKAKRPSFAELVEELLKGNESVLEKLSLGGESAVGALIAEFPGPVKAPALPTTPASECGPILKALASLGSKATPFLTVRTADENADVRRWATFLLGELPGKDSAKAIASRLLDDSVEVRRAALASARRARGDVLTRRSLRAQVEQLCRDQSLAVESRCSAIEALADIREHEAIPTLLQLLEDEDKALGRAARWALCVLTRQEFGTDANAWREFWQEHRDEDRTEWLITSLDHEQRDIRRAAGDELRLLSGLEIEYSEDLGPAERRQAQAEYRSWWKETGKADSN